MKPTVYIETTVVSQLPMRLRNDSNVSAQIEDTRKWWNEMRPHFEVFTSEVVLAEAARGDPVAAAERLDAIATVPLLPIIDAATPLAEALIVRHALPEKARVDATHIAIAATNGVHYLLTWNCKHLANATMRARIEQVCRDHGYEPPLICTPAELEGATMIHDPIVEEIHRIREQMLAEYGGDLKALIKAMQRQTDEAARAGRKVVALPPRRPKGWTEPAKKAG